LSELDQPQTTPKNAEYLLVETIRQVGVSNYSLLARLTGLNPETVRYKVNKQLSKLGLSVQVNIDYVQLGFSMYILTVKSMGSNGKSWLDQSSYLKFVGKLMGSDKYVCLATLPNRFKKKYMDSLESLRQTGVIEAFEASEVSWVRYPPLRSEFFNFEEGRWSLDWNRIGSIHKELGATSLFAANADTKVDYLDVKILKALQEDPTINPAKIAKQLSANPRTIRYHYLEHIVKGKFILDNNVRWAGKEKDSQHAGEGESMQIVFFFRDLEKEEVAQVRKICNSIPFTWLEAGTADRSYLSFLDIPPKNFHETVRYVEGNIEVLRSKFEMMMLDPAKTQSFNIPDEMFDEERGWRLFSPQDTGRPRIVQEAAPTLAATLDTSDSDSQQ
jgi:hypothetical protein